MKFAAASQAEGRAQQPPATRTRISRPAWAQPIASPTRRAPLTEPTRRRVLVHSAELSGRYKPAVAALHAQAPRRDHPDGPGQKQTPAGQALSPPISGPTAHGYFHGYVRSHTAPFEPVRTRVWPSSRFHEKGPLTSNFPDQRPPVADESACTPGSVSRGPCGPRGGGHPSRTGVAAGLVRSTRGLGRAALDRPRRATVRRLLLTLLQVGFTEPSESPRTLVVSYTTVSPLPDASRPPAVCFLWHCPAGHPGWALPTTLPCGARTFLGGAPEDPDATARPARPPC